MGDSLRILEVEIVDTLVTEGHVQVLAGPVVLSKNVEGQCAD